MSREPWVAHFGLKRTPFRKSNFWVVENALGVVTGDVGAGKTVSVRAAVSALDPTRHQIIYIFNPAFGTAASTSPSSEPWVTHPAISEPS